MQFKTYTLLALASLTSLVSADYFANFFTDENCNEDGSIGFDMTNPGCFAWAGAKSVYIPRTSFPNEQFCLVMTHDDDHCSCQDQAYDFTSTGFCAKLDGTVKSYRFIFGSCGSDTWQK
ncbi:uncharacterized protein L199_001595 [Kwoniella botswanensis]|uniref:uncharacterized protein n=1 Tax=Kwoniella botswanensis TaxID=1268659 RepID=UPI00315C9100